MKPTILIVGNGKWAQKLEAILKCEPEKYETESIGARELLSNFNEFSGAEKYDLIWIATTTSNQIKIVESEWRVNQKMILEKPLITSLEHFKALSKALDNGNLTLYASEPWTYSSIWSKFSEIVVDMNPEKIDVQRSGPCDREYLTAPQDWLPHDLFLIVDLLDRFNCELKMQPTAKWSDDFQKVHLEFQFTNLSKLNLISKKQLTRNAFWEFKTNSGTQIRLDFEKKAIFKDGNLTYFMKNENPIVTFLDSILNRYNPGLNLKTLNLMRTLTW